MTVRFDDTIKFGTLHNGEPYEITVRYFSDMWNDYWKRVSHLYLGTLSDCYYHLLNATGRSVYDVAQAILCGEMKGCDDVDIEKDNGDDLYGMTVYNDSKCQLMIDLVKCDDNDLFDFIESCADIWDLSEFLLEIVNRKKSLIWFSNLDMKIVNRFIDVMEMYRQEGIGTYEK